MAAVNYSGAIFASRAEERTEDEYEDDCLDQDVEMDEMAKRRKNSNILFQPFNEWKDVKPWNYELKNQESVECLAIGSGWCAIHTNFNYIRIFSNDGIQKHLLCQGTSIVTMVGYENFLAVIYHAGPAFLTCQTMRVKIINMQTRDYKTLIDVECPASPNCILNWAGFSEEGQLFTFDSFGVLRSLSYTEQQWTVRLDFKIRYGSIFKQIWIVGVYE